VHMPCGLGSATQEQRLLVGEETEATLESIRHSALIVHLPKVFLFR